MVLWLKKTGRWHWKNWSQFFPRKRITTKPCGWQVFATLRDIEWIKPSNYFNKQLHLQKTCLITGFLMLKHILLLNV